MGSPEVPTHHDRWGLGSVEDRMMLRYCWRHKRRWSFTRQCWVAFPAEKIRAIQAYATRLHAIDPKAPALTVRDTDCDVCAAPPWPLAPSPGASNGRHRSEL
jgi:hypothetical protein